MNISIFIESTVILLLLAASALISGAEVAFFSLGPNERLQLTQGTSKSSKRVLMLLLNPEDLLATLLVANNLINMGIVILSTGVTDSVLSFTGYPVLRFIIQIVVITFLILLIGEVLPKIYATRHAMRLSKMIAIAVSGMVRVLRPVSKVLIGSTSIVRKRMKDITSPLTMDHLSDALVLTGQELVEEEKMLKGIVRFSNISVGEIMKPRVDIFSLDIKEPFSLVFNRMIDLGYSRFPVYQENPDDIRGILYVKDFLSHLKKSDTFRWQTLIRTALFVPENKRINDLLQEFRRNKMHMAIVVDEYGGTSGLITLEDILEEIVGEIRDESDEEDSMIQKTGDKTFLCNGKTSLHDLVMALDLDEDYFDTIKGGAETIAGLLLELKGEIPDLDEQIQLNYLTFVVKNRDDRRIKEIEIIIT